jgi:hypothetical protein
LNALPDQQLDGIGGLFHRLFDLALFGLLKRPQDMLYGITSRTWTPDPHLHPEKVPAAQGLLDRTDTLVPTMPPPSLDPQLGDGEIQIVMNHNDLVGLKADGLLPPRDGGTAVVHECERLDQQDVLAMMHRSREQ